MHIDRELPGRVASYYKKGYGVYVAMIIGVLNFITIQYRFIIERVPFLAAVLPSLLMFGILFVMTAIPIIVIIGWQDYKRGMHPVEAKIAFDNNPRLKKMYDRIGRIEKMIEEVKNEKKG